MPAKRADRQPAPAAPPADADAINHDLGRRVKKLRGDHGWSLEELALASGVSRSMLSQIERRRANPTLGVADRIARAFGLTLQDLLGSAGAASAIRTIRAGDGEQIFREDEHCRIRTLSPLNLEKEIEFYEVRLAPAAALRSHPHVDGVREFLTVSEGRVEIRSGAATELLGKGDSATYRADVAHEITNPGKRDALLFLVVIYR